MSSHSFMLVVLTLCLPSAWLTQSERRDSDQKTIEISATEKVRVPAETATIKIGFQNQAATKDVAYAENTRAANKILQALLDAGVPKEAIETEALNLGQEQERYERGVGHRDIRNRALALASSVVPAPNSEPCLRIA